MEKKSEKDTSLDKILDDSINDNRELLKRLAKL